MLFNNSLGFLVNTAFVTNNKGYFMKLLFIVACLIACCISGIAGAYPPGFIEDNAYISRDQAFIQALKKQHESHKVSSIQSIDGPTDIIQISSSRTSAPNEFIEIPKKPNGEKYAGR